MIVSIGVMDLMMRMVMMMMTRSRNSRLMVAGGDSEVTGRRFCHRL